MARYIGVSTDGPRGPKGARTTDGRTSLFRASKGSIILLAMTAVAVLLLLPAAAADGPPEVSITSEGGLISGTYNLTVVVSGDLQTGEVYYGIDDDDPSIMMTDAGDGDFQAEFVVATLTEGPHTIYVKAVNTTGSSTVASLDVAVDRNSPQVVLTSEGGVVAGDFVVTANVTDVYLNTSAIYCVIDDDLEASRGYVLARVGDHYAITIDTTLLPEGDHFIRVWAFDLWGSSNKSLGTGMFIDNTGPTVEIISGVGAFSGSYRLRANVTDVHLDGFSIKAKVGGDEPVLMNEEGSERTLDIDLTPYANGALVIVIEAADTLGHSTTDSITITVDNRPDLVIVDAQWDRVKAKPGETLTVVVTVKNVGDAAASGFKVAMFAGGELLASTNVTQPLGPAQAIGYNITWVVAGKDKVDLTLKVDTDNAVAEYDEGDNVYDGTQQLEITKKADDSPGPGALFAILVLGVATWVLRGRRS